MRCRARCVVRVDSIGHILLQAISQPTARPPAVCSVAHRSGPAAERAHASPCAQVGDGRAAACVRQRTDRSAAARYCAHPHPHHGEFVGDRGDTDDRSVPDGAPAIPRNDGGNTIRGIEDEIQACDNLLRDWLGIGADCGLCGGFGHGPLANRGLRQGLGHHDQDQDEARGRAPRQPEARQRRHRHEWRRLDDRHGQLRQGEVDQAVAIARGTEGVKSVNSKLTVQKDR